MGYKMVCLNCRKSFVQGETTMCLGNVLNVEILMFFTIINSNHLKRMT